jgi:hypothetical protein
MKKWPASISNLRTQNKTKKRKRPSKSSSSPSGDQAPTKGLRGDIKGFSPFALSPKGEKEDLEGLLTF